MSSFETVLVAVLVVILIATLSAMFAWWFVGHRGRVLAGRVGQLPIRQKAELARALFVDPRLPLYTRVMLALLVGYVALPIDLIPDFIPILGQLDDIVMLSLGTALIIRSLPERVVDEHLLRLEQAAHDNSTHAA